MAWNWDETKEKAATWIAVGDFTNDEIAEKLDIGIATLYLWKKAPEFQQRVQENLKEIRERVFSAGIADRVQRVRRLNRRWNDIDKLFAARAKEHADVPGGDTGLLVRDIKGMGSGDDYETVDLYKADVGLLKEEREVAKQAAIEIGQWLEKQSHEFINLTDDELIERAKACLGGVGTPEPEP